MRVKLYRLNNYIACKALTLSFIYFIINYLHHSNSLEKLFSKKKIISNFVSFLLFLIQSKQYLCVNKFYLILFSIPIGNFQNLKLIRADIHKNTRPQNGDKQAICLDVYLVRDGKNEISRKWN